MPSIAETMLQGILKNAFVPSAKFAGDPAMMGGMPPGGMPPMDPAMMGGMPPGMPPMDPAMMGGMPPGMPPMDPAMMGGMPPGVDPMAMAAAGAPPAEISAAQGEPVDPALAAAGGLSEERVTQLIEEALKAQNGGVGTGAKPATGNKQDAMVGRLDRIESMLNRVIGVFIGKGMMGGKETLNMDAGPTAEQMMAPEQKAASAKPNEAALSAEDFLRIASDVWSSHRKK